MGLVKFIVNISKEEYAQWLASLKEGDQFAFSSGRGWGDPCYDILTVEKLTSTQIVAVDAYSRTSRFRRQTGNPVPHAYGQIEPITDKVIATNKAYKLKHWIGNMAERVLRKRDSAPTIEQLEAMHAAWVQAGGVE